MLHSGSYDPSLVTLSILIAAFASYTALDLATRLRAASGMAYFGWLGAAAFTMGGGIWAMHFVGMLAFRMPAMEVSYDLTLTLISLFLPIAVTALGFLFISGREMTRLRLLAGGLIMGSGIAAMHYTGMAAMRMPALMTHEPGWVAFSVLIALVAATAALWLSLQNTAPLQRLFAAMIMGLAVSGMHYAAMEGARFHVLDHLDQGAAASAVDQFALALWVACLTVFILILGLVASAYDRHLGLKAERDAAALRQVFETSHLYQGLLAVDGTVAYMNATALSVIGSPLRDIAGQPFWNTPWFVHTEAAPDRIRSAVTRVATGGIDNFTLTLDLPTGTRTFDFSLRPVKNAAGQVTAIVPEAVDITARLKAEVVLQQAQKMEALGNLTGGIAHDFNNLLMAVLGSLELLRKRLPDDPRAIRLLDNAVDGAKRGASLTQRMLSFARRQDLKPSPVDLAGLVRGMTDLLSRSIGPAISIETRFGFDLPPALVDANQLELALLNLCVNARDAMPDGGTITIAARDQQDHAGRAFVCLSVTDTGEGMSAQTLARAQEPFFTTKGVGKGTGLGLSMVQGLAEQSQGRLVLKSEPGLGTTAEIWLPVAGHAVMEQPAEEQPAAAGQRQLCILVVDDDVLVLENTGAMLEDLGHRVLPVQSGEDATRLLAAEDKIDLVITDQAMPGMKGLELIDWIRANRPAVPVILATGYADLPVISVAGLVRLGKPYSQALLSQAIQKAVDTWQKVA